MTVLVTGATGNVGRLVVRRLHDEGVRVRAMTRNSRRPDLPAGVEAVRGDLASPDTLSEALRGVDRLYLFPVPETASEVVGRAVEAGVRRIVTLSSGAVTGGYDTDFHLPVEQAVERSGAEWTHVRPGEFALNKLWLWGPSIRAGSVVRDPAPEAAWYPTHEADIADVAVAALTGEGHAGTAHTFGGPELISHREQVGAISRALGRAIRFEVVTPEEARGHYRAQGGFAADNADMLLGFTDYSGDGTDPGAWVDAVGEAAAAAAPATAGEVTGRPARTFAEWARDHADDFR
ncbi:NAD(P)H-binding protein [Streptomonospora nanhaiensis]|uniref:NAD(P)H-binding protein n=1 Tax=Streptomonospora nanhaiensis TaxID=1323731 RepID=A0ABY6YNI7_9ACTN|nr:NAD(P)H-binding protein [Streptomonospora nanhaiensis]WAE73962.1 NAD(P)H-binding protein [Streptomonospora nanhaiensis]